MALQFETVFGMALVAGGLTIALFGLRHVWRAGTVLRAPHVGEPEAAGAPIVRFEGTVAGAGEADPLEAPFSGAEAVVVRYVVEEHQVNPGIWILSWDVTIAEGSESVPFDVETRGTTVTVDGPTGTAILGSEAIECVGAGEALPDRIDRFHEETGLSRRPLIFGSLPGPLARIGRLIGLGRRTYSEERLEAGDAVTVVGHPIDGSGEGSGAEPTVDPLIVSDGSFRRAFLAMAKVGLVALAFGVAVFAFGIAVLLV